MDANLVGRVRNGDDARTIDWADLDLESDLQVEYQDEVAGGWEGVLNRLEAERSRVRARIPST